MKSRKPFTVTGPSKDRAKHLAPWCCKWWETITDENGTRDRRLSRWFPSRKEAQAWGKLNTERRLGSDIRRFNDTERALTLHFFKECQARGLDPRQVFDAGLQHHGAAKVSEISLADGIELMAMWMMGEKYSPRTISSLEQSIEWLASKTDKKRLVSSFASSDLIALVKERYDNHASQVSFLRYLKSFFSWAAQQGHCSARIAQDAALDPHRRRASAAKSANRRTHKRPPRLTVEQIQTIFTTAEPRFRAAFALGILAGLRPQSELMRVEWRFDDAGQSYGIDTSHRIINLHESWVTKTFMERTITDLPELFWEIIGPRQGAGRVVPVDYRHFVDAALGPAKKALGWDIWPKDIMRHTAASFQYVLIGKELAMKNLGHKNASTFDTHYLNSVSGSEAQALSSLTLGLPVSPAS